MHIFFISRKTGASPANLVVVQEQSNPKVGKVAAKIKAKYDQMKQVNCDKLGR